MTSKIKKQKDTVSNLSKYWLWYLFRLLTHFKIKTNFKFSNFSLSLCRTKDKLKRTERGMMNNCLICFLTGQFLDSKAKTRGIALNIYEVLWELWHCWYTPENLKKKNCYFLKQLAITCPKLGINRSGVFFANYWISFTPCSY